MDTIGRLACSAEDGDGDLDVCLRQAGIEPALLFSPRDRVDEEVLIPGLRAATRARGMFGYFTSGALAQLAPGLADYLMKGAAPLTLIVSPELHERDLAAVEAGMIEPQELLEERLVELLSNRDRLEESLAGHALQCLAWLIRSGRLEVLVAFPRTSRFHPKIWEFVDRQGDRVVVRGSGNATASGMSSNVEQMDVDVSWDVSSASKVERTRRELDAMESNSSDLVAGVYRLSEAIERGWLETWGDDRPPTPEDYRRLVRPTLAADAPREGVEGRPPTQGFHIPEGLRWEDGPYSHQGEAVAAWEQAGHRAILEMATGAGKTITALIGARRLLDKTGRLLVLVSAPTRPLVKQWVAECADFGLRAVDTTARGDRKGRFAEIDRVLRALRYSGSKATAIVVTNNLLNDLEFRTRLEDVPVPILMVGDEVHTLGAASFVSNPPDFVPYRLGLSATPVRQFDMEGTEALTGFFGEVAYQFGLDRAIGTCLVPYDYHVHTVRLNDVEGEEFVALSIRMGELAARKQKGGLGPEDEELLKRLAIKRRRVIETATAKIPALRDILEEYGPERLSHTLFYGSAKDPDQLNAVNAMLDDLGVAYHQITQQESSEPSRLSGLLAAFRDGDLQALTAKKVLDEGLNIPEIGTAFIIASSTVEREWVQRRGRILRQCTAIGKTKAVLHDFVVVPPSDLPDASVAAVLRGEVERIREFGRLALNAGAPGGPLDVAGRIILSHLPERD